MVEKMEMACLQDAVPDQAEDVVADAVLAVHPVCNLAVIKADVRNAVNLYQVGPVSV